VFAPSHPDAVAHGEHTVRLDQTLASDDFDNWGGRRLLFEDATHGPTGEIVKLPLYSWPTHVEVPRILAPQPLDGYATQFVSAITGVDEGRFTLRGPTADRITNQILFKKQATRAGDYLAVAGRVASGVCQFALTTDTENFGYTSIRKPGPFLLMLVPPGPGHYGVRVDCSGWDWWQPLLERGVRAVSDAVRGIRPTMDVTLDTIGWVRHDSTAPVLYEYHASSEVIHVDLFGEAPQPANREEGDSELSEDGVPAYEVFDVRAQRSRPAERYSWPRDVPIPEALSVQPAQCPQVADAVSLEEGSWVMNGPVEASGSDLLRFRLRDVRPGDTFVATGVLQEGGMGIALVNRGGKVGGVEITKPGWFAAALRVPDGAGYELVIDGKASAPLPPGSADWVPRSRFRIQTAGWSAGSPGSSRIPGPRVVFDTQKKVQRCATTYTWPLTHEFPETVPDLHPVESANLQYRAPGLLGDGTKWEMNAQADSPTSYLLEGKPLPVRKGGQFIAVGELEAGGLTIGLLKDNAWLGSRNIVEPGWFAVAVQAPEDGVYALVIANNLKAPDSTTWRSLLGRLGLGGLLSQPQNRFHIQSSGWLDR
jgi:hypothetical protein